MKTASLSVTLADVYVAYRKAKAEAFFENTHFHALAFTRYEQSLHRNLVALHRRLSTTDTWPVDLDFIGDFAYLPKSIDASQWDAGKSGHFIALDPLQEWARLYSKTNTKAVGTLRMVMRPTVDFQVVSALWILKVGFLFDQCLDKDLAFANHVRSVGSQGAREINLTTPALFAPYFSAYRNWREQGLEAMEKAVKSGESVLAMTMDIEKFYHRAAPSFLLRQSFLDAIGLELSQEQTKFTRLFLRAIEHWYAGTPDYATRPQGAIPVGLSASKVIANVLLARFDRELVEKLQPIHYGRYVDDIFLVLRADQQDVEASNVIKRMANELAPLVKLRSGDDGPSSLVLKLPYARDSELVFAGSKQKIFALSSAHGQDLVGHIREQIRAQSSEYRLLPAVPKTAVEMAARALLATPDASLQVDALRKADVVSVRRLGFSLLLSDIETYAADIKPNGWRLKRFQFYELAQRHILTPTGFFDYFGYIHRIFGLMIACGDLPEARGLVDSLVRVKDLLLATTTLGAKSSRNSFELCLQQYATALLQAGVQACTARSVLPTYEFLRVLRRLKKLSANVAVSSSVDSLQKLVRQVLLADWGRRPYKDYWFLDQSQHESGPAIPRQHSIRKQFRLAKIRRLREEATSLKSPHWPALAFPTRALRVDEIVLVAPKLLEDAKLLKDAISLFRGAQVRSPFELGYRLGEKDEFGVFRVPGKRDQPVRIAITECRDL